MLNVAVTVVSTQYLVLDAGMSGKLSAHSAAMDAQRQLMEENWACFEAAEEGPIPTQSLSALTEEADACYEKTQESDSETPSIIENVSPVAELRTSAPWWVLRIAQLTSQIPPPSTERPWNVVSGCSGLSAESWILKAGAHSESDGARFS